MISACVDWRRLRLKFPLVVIVLCFNYFTSRFCVVFSVYLLYQSKPNVKSAFDFPDLDAAANAPPANKGWGSSGGGAMNGSSSSGGGGLSGMGGGSSGGGERPKLNLAKSTIERAKSAPASPGAAPPAAAGGGGASEVRIVFVLC